MNLHRHEYTETDRREIEALQELITRVIRNTMQTRDTTNDYDILEA